MDATSPVITTAITAKLKHLAARQKLIAENIANADTPGFRARDLAAPDFASLVEGRTAKRATPAPRGASVVLEDELMKLADVQMEYAALTNLYRRQHGLLKIALGRGG